LFGSAGVELLRVKSFVDIANAKRKQPLQPLEIQNVPIIIKFSEIARKQHSIFQRK
jgi:hypothetical protein